MLTRSGTDHVCKLQKPRNRFLTTVVLTHTVWTGDIEILLSSHISLNPPAEESAILTLQLACPVLCVRTSATSLFRGQSESLDPNNLEDPD